MADKNLYGLVLAGGKSSRMGFDKGGILYHDIPQKQFVFRALSRVCQAVFTSCRQDQNVDETLNTITDHFQLPGPLNGIMSAFEKFPDCAWMSVALDMPYVDDAVLNELLASRDKSKVAT